MNFEDNDFPLAAKICAVIGIVLMAWSLSVLSIYIGYNILLCRLFDLPRLNLLQTIGLFFAISFITLPFRTIKRKDD